MRKSAPELGRASSAPTATGRAVVKGRRVRVIVRGHRRVTVREGAGSPIQPRYRLRSHRRALPSSRRRPLACSSVTTRPATARAKGSSAVAAINAAPRLAATRRMSAPTAAISARSRAALTCSRSRTAGSNAAAAAQPHAKTAARVEAGDRLRPGRRRQTDFPGDRLGAQPHLVRRRFDRQREWQREILDDGQLIEEHRALADDAEAIDGREPVGTVGDGGRGAPEHAYLSRVRKRRAGHEVDEHFRRRLIKAEDGDLLALGHGEPFDPERTQPVVVSVMLAT